MSSLQRKTARIIMLGLNEAGKTSILYKLKNNELINTIPTIGFIVETLECIKADWDFCIWDVGGSKRVRSLWKHYYSNTDGLVFVLDSSDFARLLEAQQELFNVLQSDEMIGVPLLVIANKQDLPKALSIYEVAESLQLHKVRGKNPFHVQCVSAVSGDGLLKAMEALADLIEMSYKNPVPQSDQPDAHQSQEPTLQEKRVVLLGLDAAGKTAILYRLATNQLSETIPTIGFNVETIACDKEFSITFWDVGGQKGIRSLWLNYLNNLDALIYVIDSSDTDRIMETQEELFKVLEKEELTRVPFVIIANKQDKSNAQTIGNVEEVLELHKLKGQHRFHVQRASAATGEGLAEAMQALAELLRP